MAGLQQHEAEVPMGMAWRGRGVRGGVIVRSRAGGRLIRQRLLE